MSFNPVEMVDPLEVRGVWPEKAPQEMDQQEYDVFLERVAAWHDDLTRELPGRITDTSLFRRSLVDAEAGSGVGSPNSDGRTAAPVGAATEEDTRHCDMMVRYPCVCGLGSVIEREVATDLCFTQTDWWPEHYEYPVAYHPTAPCSKEDTAYRVFDK